MDSKTINISVSTNDLIDIDNYCTMHNLTRSKFFVLSAIEKVQASHLVDSLILLNGILEKRHFEEISDQEKEDLEGILKYWGRYNNG